MFRRRTFSPNGIHYRVNINKYMCPNPVDIYIDNNIYQKGFNSSYLDIYYNKKISVISISGQLVIRNPQYEYNILLGMSNGIIEGSLTYKYDSGYHCDLANEVIYGNRTTNFTPITKITEPDEIINFTYKSNTSLDIKDTSYVDWSNSNYVLNNNCIRTDLCHGCEFDVIGVTKYNSYRVYVSII